MSDHITLKVADGIGTITFNRPEARNALSEEMREGLSEYTHQMEFDTSVRCVVLRGAGGHFMAGGDIKVFKEREKLDPLERKAVIIRFIHDLHFAIYRMRKMPKPMICAVQGAAAGAGVSLVAACDMAIAAESAYFTLAYAKIGVNPDGSSTFFLPRTLGMKKTFEMMYLADRYDAKTALEMGLVNSVVADDELDAAIDKLARRLADGPTYAYARGKALLNSSLHETLESQLELEGYAIGDCMMTEDHIEGITAFIEKRAPVFKGR
ncbi:MAG: enoyl-CoA hydratase [SAR324 cluster bacterium]|nr:enoyl-CoA hydratase [SAR324 cluster bacterium]